MVTLVTDKPVTMVTMATNKPVTMVTVATNVASNHGYQSSIVANKGAVLYNFVLYVTVY